MIDIEKNLNRCHEQFKLIEQTCEHNSVRILDAFIKNKVSEAHFCSSTGYGYGNLGRSTLNKVFADYFSSEDAIVSENFVSGTHTISTALFAITSPGDTILFVTGKPYDTLENIVNGEGCCSLKDYKVNSIVCDFYVDDINFYLMQNPKVVYIQRSRGYSARRSLTITDIEYMIEKIKKYSPESIIIVDNCYGEFVETREPTMVGADLVIGSLIKNPGGGISPGGGYIVGRKNLVNLCEQRFLAPGLTDMGMSRCNRELFMGFFYAPLAVREAMKTAVFASVLFSEIGFKVNPSPSDSRADIVTSIDLKSKENLLKFCESIQKHSPIDSFVEPVPCEMPGYNHEIIMSSGGFISGSSIELSADAPVKPPYRVFFQGGTNYYLAKKALISSAKSIYR